jgi:hypothetical protein
VQSVHEKLFKFIDKHEMTEMDSYVDISENNSIKEIGVEYTFDADYEFYEALLEYRNIENKRDYLILLKHFYNLIDLRLQMKEEGMEMTNSFVLNGSKRTKILEKIKLYLEKNNFKTEQLSVQLLNQIYNYIENELEKLDLDLEALNFLFNLPFNWYSYQHTPYSYKCINSAKAVLIYLFKSFYESGKFKKLVENLTSIKKSFFVMKLEEVDIEREVQDNKYVCGVFDLYKHKEDSYEGYELRRLFKELEELDICFSNVSSFE